MTKTEADEDENRLSLGTSEVAASDDTPEWPRRNLILLLSCDQLTPEPIKDAAVSAAPSPIVEPPQSSRSWTCSQENVGYEALTVPSGCANWSDSRLTTELSVLRPKLNEVLSSSFLKVLCALNIWLFFLCSVKVQHIWSADHIKQAVLVGHDVSVIASHSKACKTDSCGLYSTRFTTNTCLLPLLPELSLACPLSLSVYTDHWWLHIR